MEPLGHTGSSPCQSPSVAPTAAHLFTGLSRKQETRVCKGINILSAIGLTERGPPTVTGGLLESETELCKLSADPKDMKRREIVGERVSERERER